MTKIVATALLLSSALIIGAIAAKAQEAPNASNGTVGNVSGQMAATATGPFVKYTDARRDCGVEWKARADKDVNKGATAYQTFLAACVVRHGYVKGRKAPTT